MDEELIETARLYAEKHGVNPGDFLGAGIHGRVCLLMRGDRAVSVLKVHRDAKAYRRERDVYHRLAEHEVTVVRGFSVPQLLHWDDELLALEMTAVSPPRVLDFAADHLDWPPDFSDEIWAEWEERKREQFGDDWPMVQIIRGDFEEMGIFMLDPSPDNICLR